MRRREFITLLGGLRRRGRWRRARSRSAMPVIGFLGSALPELFVEVAPARVSPGPQGHRLCRRRECRNRIPLGGRLL